MFIDNIESARWILTADEGQPDPTSHVIEAVVGLEWIISAKVEQWLATRVYDISDFSIQFAKYGAVIGELHTLDPFFAGGKKVDSDTTSYGVGDLTPGLLASSQLVDWTNLIVRYLAWNNETWEIEFRRIAWCVYNTSSPASGARMKTTGGKPVPIQTVGFCPMPHLGSHWKMPFDDYILHRKIS